MVLSRIKSWLTWSWTYLWALWFILVLILVYILRGPLKISESFENGMLTTASSYFNNLTPKFYVALTGTSSLVSGIILIFEWWYFKNNASDISSEDGSDNEESLEASKVVTECKVWRNPMALFRGAEYNRVKTTMRMEPLTFYDMNLSAQDHQSFFTSDEDASRPDLEMMNVAWRERDSWSRVNAAREALRINSECAPALVLLAEEDCETISETENMFKRALKATELSLVPHHGSQLVPHEKFSTDLFHRQGSRRRDLNMLAYIRRRLAMCARRQGRLRDALKIFKEILRDATISNILGVHENLIETCLEMQAYADVQGMLVRYDGSEGRDPRSSIVSYTSALLKIRTVVEKFIFDPSQRRGLSSAETTAIEAITRAIEFNPHVPLYLLEQRPMILPPEHYLKRGDSEAISYAFFHIQHWKRIDGALQLLHSTWRGDFIEYASRFQSSGYCNQYSSQTEVADRELLPEWHEVSVFPRKDSPMWAATQTFMCLITCGIAMLAHYYPTNASQIVFTGFESCWGWIQQVFDTMYRWFPDNVVGLLSAKPVGLQREIH